MTAVVGIRNIEEERRPASKRPSVDFSLKLNVTNMFEGVIGAGLYNIFTHPLLNRLVAAFEKTFLNIAHTGDDRTLILQIFVYISLIFTLLTIPFIELLRRELERRKVEINLGKRP